MKKLPLYLSIVLIFLCSCKKNNSGSSTPSDYYLSSVVASQLGTRIVDSFYYDTLHRINTFIQSIYDTPIIGQGAPYVSTWNVQFIYQGSNAWPSSYTYYQSSPGYYSGYHLLSDDSANRIIKDTCLNGTGNVFYFSYPNNEIVITAGEIASFGGYTNTLFISNGNISQEASYTPSVPSTTLPANFFYAPVANPGYHPLISDYIGPLLNILNTSSGMIVDFISKNAWQGSSQSEGPSGPVSTTSYTLETDNKGRLVKMMLTSFPVTWNTVLFNYY